jgi:hypothetical protein
VQPQERRRRGGAERGPAQPQPVVLAESLGQGGGVGIVAGTVEEEQRARHGAQRLLDAMHDRPDDLLARARDGEVAGDVQKRAARAVGVVVLDPLEHVGDAFLDRDQQRRQNEARAERDDVLAGRRHVAERAVQKRVQQHERHPAQQHGAGGGDCLADEDLDIPEAPLQDRVGECEGNQHQRNDGHRREQRRLESEGAGERRENQKGSEPDDDAERDPADLLLGLRVLARMTHQVDQARQDRRDVGREVQEPETCGPFENRGRRRRGRGAQDRQLRRGVGERRQVEHRNHALQPHGPREDQEEVEEQRGEERAEDILGHPEQFPERVVRARGRQDVHAERGQAECPEDERGGRTVARDREEADEQVEEADEGEEQVNRVEAHRGRGQGEAAHLAARNDHQRVRERLARQLLFGSG